MTRSILLAMFLLASLALSAGEGRIVIVNVDGAGVGFNDPTPVAPVGGNAGTTLGQQRLNVFEAAAARWDALLDTEIDILVRASFAPISGCTETAGILGHANAWDWKINFKSAPQPDVWYPIALANALAGEDLAPSQPDITLQFNADVDNATCLGDANWYYGLDAQHGPHTDLYVVVLHEIAHGLGVSSAGAQGHLFAGGKPSVYDTHLFDVTTGQRWTQMSQEQRLASMNNTAKLVWDGPAVRDEAPRILDSVTLLSISEPSALAASYDIGQASFGPPADRLSLSGRLVQAVDAANPDGPVTTDGCSTFANAEAIEGHIAVVDRGTCTFVSKALNAQTAGAVALVILDNSRDTCIAPSMSGEGDEVRIPVISLGAMDGDRFKAQLASATVRGRLHRDPSRLAGASSEGYVRVYAPCQTSAGSSKHHWDTPARPNLLMEPSVSSDLLHGVDLTHQMLIDMGWPVPGRSGRRALRR